MADEPKPEEQAAPAAAETPPATSQPASSAPSAGEQPAASEDALEQPDSGADSGVIDATSEVDKGKPDGDGKPPKKPNALKKFFKKVDVYLLGSVLIMVFAGGFGIVNYLNSKKAPAAANIATQKLTQSALKALANSDATIGNAAQTLTVQGNAIFSGQVLVRSDLNVAGNIQLGGALTAPSLVVSGNSNLNATQISSLQVATTATIQGTTTLKDLNVAGASSFSGPITASQITVTKLVISGNGVLDVPNHLGFTGPSPSRSSVNQAALGSGGTASVNGSDTDGTVNMNSGNNPAAGCYISINFSQPFANTPHVILSPVGAAAGAMEYYVTRTNTGFSVCSDNAPQANQVFAFDYFITD